MARYFAQLNGPGLETQRADFNRVADAKAWADNFGDAYSALHVWQGNWRCAGYFERVAGKWKNLGRG